MKSQFYLVENPKMNMDDEQFIYHSKNPRFFAKILPFQEDFDIAIQEHEGLNTTFFYISPESLREVHTLVVVERIDQATDEQIESKLKRAADWYVDYLMWEDRQQTGKGGQKVLLADWSPSTPGLKILYSDFAEKWMIIYRGIVKTFENEPEMDNYLINKLNFTDDQLQEGSINTI